MSAEDILACEDATKVVVSEEKVPFNDDTRVVTVTEQVTPYFSSTYDKTIHDVEEMTVTGIGVCLSEESEGDGDWMIIHHFCWDVNPGFYGTESIQLWPAYQTNTRNRFRYVDEPTGRVLYTKNGVDYVSDYYTLAGETYTFDSIFWGEQTNNDVFATFSLPDKGERQRVYVMYAGKVAEHASVEELFRRPLHPYTNGLLHSLPKMQEGQERLYNIRGMVPDLLQLPKGCRFAPRCDKACARCHEQEPDLYDAGDGHLVRCFLYEKEEAK